LKSCSISIIFGTYKENSFKTLGFRGITKDDLLGFPNSHGNPTFMPVPDKLALVMLEGLWAKREMTEKNAIRDGFQKALDELRERES
jgi:hypothetical protein